MSVPGIQKKPDLPLASQDKRAGPASKKLPEGTPQVELRSEELRSDLKWHLLAQPLYFLHQSTLHEGSHALTALLLGHPVTQFKPYPHTYGTPSGERRFLFTGGIKIGDDRYIVPPGDRAAITAVPTFLDIALFSATDLALSQSNPDSWGASLAYFGGMVWPWIDFTLNINLVGPHSDVGNWSRHWGLNPYGVQISGDLLAAVGLWRLVDRGSEVLWSEPGAASSESLRVEPKLGSDQASLLVTGAF